MATAIGAGVRSNRQGAGGRLPCRSRGRPLSLRAQVVFLILILDILLVFDFVWKE